MPGCSVAAASMTGSTELGPIQGQQDSPPLLDEGLFAEHHHHHRPRGRGCYSARPDFARQLRRRMSTPTAVAGQPVQLTPLWEYVVRTKKFPKDVDVPTIFEEISERLRDPEWEVRQHALRVLVDVLPTFGPESVDGVASLVLEDLVENLGNPAPAVRKGSLDALRIYLLHTPSRDEMTKKILHDGMNRADVLDDYQTSVATGVILSTPLLLFPSRSSTRPSGEVVREATQALAMRLVQVTHQESALRSLAKIRDAVGDEELSGYLREMDDSMKRNFDLLCDVYGIRRASGARRRRPKSKSSGNKRHSADVGGGNLRRKDSVEESIKDVLATDKSWESEDDSDTSGIAEDDNSLSGRLGSGSSVSSARVVLETEIKFDEETAITMTILEEQDREAEEAPCQGEDEADFEPEIEAAEQDAARRKTPRRVHFGGEIVKLRTPDSEDTESVLSDLQPQPAPPPPTRIPLPVAPATRLPRRVRSSSQPSDDNAGHVNRPQRRSASSSPASRRRKELTYTHDANLSPKKSILSKNVDRQLSPASRSFEIQEETMSRPRSSRRDSLTPSSSPRVIIEEIVDPPPPPEPSFRVCEEPQPDTEDNNLWARTVRIAPSPSLLGDVVEESKRDIDSIFGDRSGLDFSDKLMKNHENIMRSVYRARSAQENDSRLEWQEDDRGAGQGKDRRRTQSAKSPGFEVFPRQERNYILMELSSPVKETSRRSSLEDNQPQINDPPTEESAKSEDKTEPPEENKENNENPAAPEERKSEESQVDSNKSVEESEREQAEVECNDEEQCEAQLDDDLEKCALDAKERSSDSSSDGEWRNKEPSWEELGLVDEEVLTDFHNRDDWRARVRGLERIASAMRTSSALEAVEPRVGSLLHAVLGGERSCRVAAAGMAVARVLLTGVSEEALKDRLSLIAWGLARQGGPNAAHLARLTMLRTSPGLFLEKLLHPQCIGARNAKMRENTLQLLIFSLVTFPSTEFKVKSAIDKVVAMVGDRRKRVRHASLDTLAVLSQIYESEDILEASKRFTKGKQDGQAIQEAIKTRLSRRLLPTVSVDGLVVYGLQISSNTQYTGADVEWIVAGSGSVSPGTGRTRGQLIAMSKLENEAELNNSVKKTKSRPASEHSISTGNLGLLEKNERTSSWKLLPQSDQNERKNQDIKSRKSDRTSKSADLSKVNNSEFKYYNDELHEKSTKTQKPYATPKRNERKSERQISNDPKVEQGKENVDNSVQERRSNATSVAAPRQESRIPIYTRDRIAVAKTAACEMNGDTNERRAIKDGVLANASDSNGYLGIRRRKLHPRSAVPRMNHTINHSYSNNSFIQPPYDRSFEDTDAELQAKLKDNYKFSPLHSFAENSKRTLSYEKLNKGFDTVIKNSREGLRSVPHYQYSSKATENYESIYQRQQRLKDSKGPRIFETASGPVNFYENYSHVKKVQSENSKLLKNRPAENRSSQKRRMFFSPFDDRSVDKSVEILDKDAGEPETTDSGSERNHQQHSARTSTSSTGSKSMSQRASTAPRDAEDLRSNSGSSSSSLRSAPPRLRGTGEPLPEQVESSDESIGGAEVRSRAASSPRLSSEKAFDVISAKSSGGRDATDAVSIHTEPDDEADNLSLISDEHQHSAPTALQNHDDAASNSSTAERASLESAGRLSRGSLLSARADEDSHRQRNAGDRSTTPAKSRPASRCSGEQRDRHTPKGSMAALNGVNGSAEDAEAYEYAEEEDDEAFETLDFRNSRREASSGGGGSKVLNSPVRSRASLDYEDVRNTDSNVTLYSCDSPVMSPKRSSPKRFISENPESKDTDDSAETPPLPIGFDGVDRGESTDSADETDDVGIKPQPSRLPTPVETRRQQFKCSPCKLRPQANCHRATSVPAVRHVEKSSKMVNQCFAQLEHKDWEVTLKGLRTLAQIAREEPEQLDVCAPGLLARVLGKHVKNLRSQVARVACTTAGDVFSAHIRGIEQDIDEIAGPLLHRTADTNRFLREDCNAALNSMIEHFPPHRTIMTIANRGASHQNTIVHATTARLLYLIVTEIGPEHVMVLPREVKDKLFATTAKLLTDGNLQARKHAKETFKLLSRCQGFRKALTDAVPESTLRLIDKTLRTL